MIKFDNIQPQHQPQQHPQGMVNGNDVLINYEESRG